MSPASSGNLEVEHYIGACLISQNRSKKSRGEHLFSREHFIPDIYQGNYVNVDGRYRIHRCSSVDGWAGGMPLISFANHQQRRGRRLEQPNDGKSCAPRGDDQPSNLARLAVHTQGAPLILSKSYNHRKNKVHRNSFTKSFDNTNNNKNKSSCQEIPNNVVPGGVDAVSVTSDESSGSANSENCLPRIIKPRKRRKKDRKPPLLGHPLSQDGFSTDSASPDIDNTSVGGGGMVNLRPIIPFSFDRYAYRSVSDRSNLNNSTNLIDRYQIVNDISETPKLHHTFEDIEEVDDGKDINGNQPTSTCQCRYCDPAGQIWDVDRNCYSPFLTPPNDSSKTFHFPNINLSCIDYSTPLTVLQNNCLIHSMSSVSLDEEQHDTANNINRKKKRGAQFSGDLKVSTEIVTSLNGHRDLEIKFFSTSNAENVLDKDKSMGGKIDEAVCGGNNCENTLIKCANEQHSVGKFTSEE